MNVGIEHDWLMANVFYLESDDSSVFSIVRDDVREGRTSEPKLMFTRNDVAPEAFNLLRTAPMLYQQLTYQYGVLQALIEALEASKVAGVSANLIKSLLDSQNAIMLTQRAAVEGIEKVADELNNKEPPTCPR